LENTIKSLKSENCIKRESCEVLRFESRFDVLKVDVLKVDVLNVDVLKVDVLNINVLKVGLDVEWKCDL
jgi:hypothetical protein